MGALPLHLGPEPRTGQAGQGDLGPNQGSRCPGLSGKEPGGLRWWHHHGSTQSPEARAPTSSRASVTPGPQRNSPGLSRAQAEEDGGERAPSLRSWSRQDGEEEGQGRRVGSGPWGHRNILTPPHVRERPWLWEGGVSLSCEPGGALSGAGPVPQGSPSTGSLPAERSPGSGTWAGWTGSGPGPSPSPHGFKANGPPLAQWAAPSRWTERDLGPPLDHLQAQG